MQTLCFALVTPVVT